jgi:hypothetical protein
MHSDPNSKFILNALSDINLNTTFAVDELYLDAREKKLSSYKDNNGKKRTREERCLDIDCEFADEIVRNSGKDYILPSTEARKHDFRFRKDPEQVIWCIDNKVLHEDIFWLHTNKYMQYLESFNNGHLHYFAFWKFMDRPTKPLKLGDKPEMLVLSVIPAGQLLMKMCNPKEMTKDREKYKVKVI